MVERRRTKWSRADWLTVLGIGAPIIIALAGWAIHVETRLAIETVISTDTNDRVKHLEVMIDKFTTLKFDP